MFNIFVKINREVLSFIFESLKEPEPNDHKENPLTACNGKNCGDSCCGPACGWFEYGKCNKEGTCMTWPNEPKCEG